MPIVGFATAAREASAAVDRHDGRAVVVEAVGEPEALEQRDQVGDGVEGGGVLDDLDAAVEPGQEIGVVAGV